MSPMSNAFTFLISTVVDAYLYILILRLLLQRGRASWHNQLVQFIVKLTDVVVKPARRFMPGMKGFDFAIIFWVVVLQFLESFIIMWWKASLMPGVLGILVVTVAAVLMKLINVYFFAVIITAILSWFPKAQGHPIASLVIMIAEPIMSFARRYIPLIGGIDLSPIVIIIGLQLISILVLSPISLFGLRLAFIG